MEMTEKEVYNRKWFKEGDFVRVTNLSRLPGSSLVDFPFVPGSMKTIQGGIVEEIDEDGYVLVRNRGDGYYYHPSWLEKTDFYLEGFRSLGLEALLENLISIANMKELGYVKSRRLRGGGVLSGSNP